MIKSRRFLFLSLGALMLTLLAVFFVAAFHTTGLLSFVFTVLSVPLLYVGLVLIGMSIAPWGDEP